jgi:hypothetical protein
MSDSDLKAEIWHSLIETQYLTDYWRGSKHQVIERYIVTYIKTFTLSSSLLTL